MIPHSRPTIEADDLAAVDRVLRSGHLAQGREVQAFEEEAAAALGLGGGVATNSGTAALHLALLSLGIGPGAEVLIPAYTCVALLHAVRLTGATARIVDSDPDTLNMGVEAARRHLTAATRAIIVPHMFGTVAPVEAFRSLGVPIIENCAHALGATVHGAPAGGAGDLAVLSFYATKMITTGEGGMLLSRSPDLLAVARDRRDYDHRATHRQRFNYKMTEMQAALGRSQLRKLSRFVERRETLARIYRSALREPAPAYTGLRDGDVVYRYVVRVPDPDAVIRSASAHGVECKRPVHSPLDRLARTSFCPRAAEVFRHAVSLPLYPSLPDAIARKIADLTAQIVARHDEPAEAFSLGSPA